ncbi:MAG: outer membrane protein assembly factor BamE [Alphaproteobacteria bacterium]|jgi:outer membrane protein assembly factor BamE (lipoprotein component of BamABCDE complex)|tara:strand:- start:14981 stop:15430 length:450 start_codon:yes stop_codon:yes gene_type:complete
MHLKKLTILLIISLSSSCASTIVNRGYVADKGIFEQINIGMRKNSVENIMGSPSYISAINGETYYYLSSKFESNGFLKPKEIERSIFSVQFDDNEIIKNISNYGLSDGKVFDYINRRTISRGTELTLLQDLFDDVGRYTNAQSVGKTAF